MSIYLKEINEFPLLSQTEELHLGKIIFEGKQAKKQLDEYKNNDKKLIKVYKEGLQARKKLANSNYRLVVHQSKKYNFGKLKYLDLIQEGNLGLLQAINSYNYKLGNRFSTYAVYWIDQALKRAVDNLARTIRVPIYVLDNYRKANKYFNNYYALHQKYPDKKLMLKKLKIRKSDYEKTKYVSFTTSLDAPLKGSPQSTLIKVIKAKGILNPSEQYNVDQKYKNLYSALKTLTKNEQIVITYRFGLYEKPNLTLKELSEKLSLSIERIRQIQNKALKKLKKNLKTSYNN